MKEDILKFWESFKDHLDTYTLFYVSMFGFILVILMALDDSKKRHSIQCYNNGKEIINEISVGNIKSDDFVIEYYSTDFKKVKLFTSDLDFCKIKELKKEQ